MVPHFTGRRVDWDDARGHGWIETDGQRIFLHRREFAEFRKRPEIGDSIRFIAGTGPTGEICARNAVHLNDGGHFGWAAASLLVALLVLPAFARERFPVDPRILTGYAFLVSLIAYGLYAHDKRRAREKGWRVSEATLHFIELIGGWPGAFIAQRRLRHKCSKISYQAVFWLIVIAYQFAAIDALMSWSLSRSILHAVIAALVSGIHHR